MEGFPFLWKTKGQITHKIIDYILSGCSPSLHKVYITNDFDCFLKDDDGQVTKVNELSFNHYEADPRIALHSMFAFSSST